MQFAPALRALLRGRTVPPDLLCRNPFPAAMHILKWAELGRRSWPQSGLGGTEAAQHGHRKPAWHPGVWVP